MTDREELEQKVEVERQRFVLFKAGGTRCALGMDVVQQVIRPSKITRVPRVPPYILGVTNLRGRILPVVDLCMRLGVRAVSSSKPRILVTQVDESIVGYLVSEVLGTVFYAQGEIQPPLALKGGISLELIRGVVASGGRNVILLLNLRAMIAADRAELA